MRINQALVAELETAATDAGENVFPAPLPDPVTLPAITYMRVSRVPEYVYANPISGHGDTGGSESRWQLDIYATTKAAAEDVAEQVKAHLSGFHGVMGGGSGVTVGWVFMDNEFDAFDSESGRHRIIQEYLIEFDEAIA